MMVVARVVCVCGVAAAEDVAEGAEANLQREILLSYTQ
jgi:hypothetical protein